MIRTLHSLGRSHARRFLKFAVCGGLGAMVDFGVLFLCVRGFLLHPKIAYILSTGAAMLVVFMTNRSFAFRAHGTGIGRQATRFLAVYLVSAFLNYVLSLGFYSLGFHFILAKGLAIGLMMLLNYTCLHSFVFPAIVRDA